MAYGPFNAGSGGSGGGKPKLIGNSAPTSATAGDIGQDYLDTSTGNEYTCVAISTVGGTSTYTWQHSAGNKVDLDTGGTVNFSIGCDNGGFYVITPDE